MKNCIVTIIVPHHRVFQHLAVSGVDSQHQNIRFLGRMRMHDFVVVPAITQRQLS